VKDLKRSRYLVNTGLSSAWRWQKERGKREGKGKPLSNPLTNCPHSQFYAILARRLARPDQNPTPASSHNSRRLSPRRKSKSPSPNRANLPAQIPGFPAGSNPKVPTINHNNKSSQRVANRPQPEGIRQTRPKREHQNDVTQLERSAPFFSHRPEAGVPRAPCPRIALNIIANHSSDPRASSNAGPAK
jgi:cytoskeletal protein RodZ